MRAFAIGFAVIGLGILSAQTAAAQLSLFDAGLLLAASEDGIRVVARVEGIGQAHCEFDPQLLEAEAERALRRDGIASRSASPALLLIDVAVTGVPARGCVVHLDTSLLYVASAVRGSVMLATKAATMMVDVAPAHVGRVRQALEEDVSVIANAIRRAQEHDP